MPAQIPRSYGLPTLQQNANSLPEWIKNQLAGKETELTNILRWEDDGGLIIRSPKAPGQADKEILKRNIDDPYNHDRN